MFNLGELISKYILWIVPIISIMLTLMVIIISTPDNELLNLKDLLSIGVNLCVSAITILITNYKSSTTAWLILFSFIVVLFTAILIRKFMWKSTMLKIISSIILFIIGFTLSYIAVQHAIGNIQSNIHYDIK